MLLEQPEPALARYAETLLYNGLRVVAVRDDRSPLVEVRLRTPFGFFAQAGGDGLRARTDGEWFDMAGSVPASSADELLAHVAATVEWTLAPALGPARLSPDDLLRQHWSAPRPVRRRPSPVGGVLVAVGQLDPELFLGQVRDSLSSWREAAWRFAPWGADDLVVAANDDPDVRLVWNWREPQGDKGSPARYLSIAIMAARLSQGQALTSGYEVYPGRDVFLGVERVYLKVRVPLDRLDEMTAWVSEELRRAVDEPPTVAETDAAIKFCGGQLLGAFDSPARTADMLRLTVASGRDPQWLTDLPARLRTVTPTDAAVAMRELFDADPHCLTLTGDVSGLRGKGIRGIA